MYYTFLFLALLVPQILIANQDLTRARCDSIMDLIIVLDSSGSIGATEFQRAKQALVDMVSALNVAPRKVHITVINYSSTVTVPIVFRDVLLTNFTIQMLIQKINAIPYLNSGTATGDALNEARDICDRMCRPFTDGAARSVVVLTDGYSNVGAPVQPAASNLAHRTRANIFAIGIGTGINKAELDIIASKPQYVLQLSNYMQLTQVINNITITTCDMPVFVFDNIKIESEVSENKYRYYQMDATTFPQHTSGKGAFVAINVVNRKGNTRVFTSTTNTNPQEGSSRELKSRSSRDDSLQFYMEYVDSNSKEFYFSILGVNQLNEYEFLTHVYDESGNVIG